MKSRYGLVEHCGLIHSWIKSMLPRDRAGKLGCGKIVEDFIYQAVARFNLVDKREIEIDLEMRNEIMVAMFGDDYFGNGMQERPVEEQEITGISVRKKLQKSRDDE